MKNMTIALMIAVLWGAAGISQAEESLETRLANLEAAVKAQKSAKQADANSAPAPQTQDANATIESKVKSLESTLAALRAELNNLKAEKSKTAEGPDGKAQAGSIMTQKQIEDIVVKTVGEKKLDQIPDWVKKLKISGDLRYRHESIDAKSGDDWATGQSRHRIRARVNVGAQVNDEMDVVFGVATGSADPVSTNQTLEDSFSRKPLWVDLAYFAWHPTDSGLNVTGGKIKNPFYSVGKNQLIWDSDLTPEGIGTNYVVALGKNDKLNFNGAGTWVDEDSAGVDTSLWGAQTYLKHEFENKDYVLAGASYFDYGNIQGRGNLKSTWSTSSSFFGNTSSASTFASDYDLLELFGEYGFAINKFPIGLFGNYVKNTVASTSNDTGWLAGFKLNQAKDPGSWEFSYNYRDLQADAVLGAFTDSDFIGGGTNGKGHVLGFTYQVYKNVQAALTSSINKRGENDDDYRRFQADLLCKF